MVIDRKYLDGDDLGKLVRDSIASGIAPHLPPGYKLEIDVVFHGSHGKQAAGETASLRAAMIKRALASASRKPGDKQPEDEFEPPAQTRLSSVAAIVTYRIIPPNEEANQPS